MISAKDLEWATFLYNAMGEDILYMEDSVKVSEALKMGTPGKSIVDFLNHWRMRIPKKKNKIDEEIDYWYSSQGKELFDDLPFSLLEINLNDTDTKKKVSELYSSLYREYIRDTSTSKILHIIKPDLFVMWDNKIRMHYLEEAPKEIEPSGASAYIYFLKKMQFEAKSLKDEDKSLASRLSENLKKLYEGILANTSNNEYKAKLSNAIKVLGTQGGRPITKFLDEYNWVKVSKNAAIPPSWHP